MRRASMMKAVWVIAGLVLFSGVVSKGADDALVTLSGVTGSNGGDQYANGMVSLTNGSGIVKLDALDPSTWTFNNSNYWDEWMAGYLVGATNSKVAWASFDCGAPTRLSRLWLFNTNYQVGISGTRDYNLYHAHSPSVALPPQPPKNTYAVTGLTPQGDYDFSSLGWTMFNSSGVLTAPKSAITSVDLTGIIARYIAIEILTNHGDTYGGGRVGFDEVALTLIPPPSGSLLLIQ